LEIGTDHRDRPDLAGIASLLSEAANANHTDGSTGQLIVDIAGKSKLLQQRTKLESQRIANHQVLVHTLQDDDKQVRRELSQFLMIRNKLVHRARIDHPLLAVVRDRAKNRLYDLLRDISAQLTSDRIKSSVDEVLLDYRDTYDELLDELGRGPIPVDVLIQRIGLA